MDHPIEIFSLTHDEFRSELTQRFGKSNGVRYSTPLYRAVFNHGIISFNSPCDASIHGTIPDEIKQSLAFPEQKITVQEDSGVRKFATRLSDNAVIESVLIPKPRRTTLCVSSQVGCRMGCTFCLTGSNGFTRNLTVAEIVSQVFTARFILKSPVDNIVFMGMGEPLDNSDNVFQAIRVMIDQRGLSIPRSRITISTSGHIDGIQKLARSDVSGVGLAVSINAAEDTLRSTLMPINKRYPLSMLKELLLSFALPKGKLFFIEYVLIAGVNDSEQMAEKLSAFLEGLPMRVNLIAYNENGRLPFRSPSAEQMDRFRKRLVADKIFVRVRQSFGQGIMAACGQLQGTPQNAFLQP